MNILDAGIILFLVINIVRGIRLGLVQQIGSTAGFFAGLFLGVFIQGKLNHLASDPTSKALLTLVVVLGCAMVFLYVGEYLAGLVRSKLDHVRILHVLDRGFGGLVGGVTLIIGVWLTASVFTKVPAPDLQRQIRSSKIIAALNHQLPPAPNVIARLGHLIAPNGFPQVFNGLEPRPENVPLPELGDLKLAVEKATASVVKIEGEGCGGIAEGSGFVADNGLVITNAHVVAGVARPQVIDANGEHSVQVIWFNPDLDLAILRASGLAGGVLPLNTQIADKDTPAAIMGYPGGGPFTVSTAAITASFTAVGRDIYNQGVTQREVYSFSGEVIPGNSGGPLVAKDGTVIGVIFAESATYDQVGYALTMPQVVQELTQAKTRNKTVNTGSCTE